MYDSQIFSPIHQAVSSFYYFLCYAESVQFDVIPLVNFCFCCLLGLVSFWFYAFWSYQKIVAQADVMEFSCVFLQQLSNFRSFSTEFIFVHAKRQVGEQWLVLFFSMWVYRFSNEESVLSLIVFLIPLSKINSL